MSIIQEPILTELNNGILSGHFAMPMKDITSDNETTFSLNRRIYFRTFPKQIPSVSTNINDTIERHALALSDNMISIQGPKTIPQKKWIGGCRDASQIIKNRRISTTGAILSNTSPYSFKNISDNNTARDALIRCRSQGQVVPPKCTHSTTIF
jgi:hypothetical protein